MQNPNSKMCRIVLFFVFMICMSLVEAQTSVKTNHNNAPVKKAKDVYVDKAGVMRWGDSKEEVYGFGINYTAPFAHAYRSAKKLNVDLEKAIAEDVYHFARLGFDAFRVHVWDTEISDTLGNLLSNEHLRLFDFMLMKMKERGIKILLTPIAFWGNGYPDRDEKTPGFSHKYGKDACLVNADAIAAQERYLFQFLNHVNPYTKIAYKDDPDVVAFEVSNEPHHRGTPQEVTRYINRMVGSMRKTGCKKPIMYNVSHSIHLSDAYFDADIDGGTFQWYPTGLGAQRELQGNFLPNVDRYSIPFANNSRFKSIAKIVYEFDAADVGRSYIYPAMARTFREAGIQWATHFAYDPTYMAHVNTEYNTHYMNLVYAPQKALSLKIASEVFHSVPMYKKYGTYPANTRFDSFSVSYEEDLAEMVTDKKFLYTNNTKTVPPDVKALEEISGFGNSPVVRYDGMGAYFLDRIQDGVWRLEVMPDAIWIDNVFGWNNLKKEVAVVNWSSWNMNIALPDLGDNFTIRPLKKEDDEWNVKGTSFEISPGVYLLTRPGITHSIAGSRKWKNIRIDEFVAPATTLTKDYVLHTPYTQVTGERPVTINTTVVTRTKPEEVSLHVLGGFRNSKVIQMKNVHGYQYVADIPAEYVKPGYLSYYIVITNGNGVRYAYGQGAPSELEYSSDAFSVPVIEDTGALYLFNAVTDARDVSREWRRGTQTIPHPDPGAASLLINVERLSQPDQEYRNGPVINDYSLRYNFNSKISGRRQNLPLYKKIVFKGKSIDNSFPVQIALIDKSGNAFGGLISLDPGASEYVVRLDKLEPVKLVTLPRPYPTFLPYYFENNSSQKFDVDQIESFQISVGPGLTGVEGPFKFTIESIRLE